MSNDRKRLRDRDSADLVDRLRFAFLFALAMSIPTTILLALMIRLPLPLPLTILGSIAGWHLLGWWSYPALGAVSAGLLRMLIAQGGDPVAAGHSEQDALVAAGRLADAADSFRSRLVAYPGDVEARIRLAALLASLQQPAEAVHHYRIARARRLTAHQRLAITTGLADIHRARRDDDRLADELSRCAREFPRSAAGEHARRELRALVAARAAASRGAPPPRTG